MVLYFFSFRKKTSNLTSISVAVISHLAHVLSIELAVVVVVVVVNRTRTCRKVLISLVFSPSPEKRKKGRGWLGGELSNQSQFEKKNKTPRSDSWENAGG